VIPVSTIFQQLRTLIARSQHQKKRQSRVLFIVSLTASQDCQNGRQKLVTALVKMNVIQYLAKMEVLVKMYLGVIVALV